MPSVSIKHEKYTHVTDAVLEVGRAKQESTFKILNMENYETIKQLPFQHSILPYLGKCLTTTIIFINFHWSITFLQSSKVQKVYNLK